MHWIPVVFYAVCAAWCIWFLIDPIKGIDQ